jgi:hypothetical protein
MRTSAGERLRRVAGLLGVTALQLLGMVGPQLAVAQGQPRSAAADARTQAPYDPTGYWVSLITQDWRFRMVVPGRGEYIGIPINAKAKEFADAWQAAPDVAAGKQCEAYGAAALMQIPERLHITWRDANTLEVQTDAGMQTRELYFQPSAAQKTAEQSWQGNSMARWAMFVQPRGFGGGLATLNLAQASKPPPPVGSIVVTTSDMPPGLLRKNGMPYSSQATLTEYWEGQADPVAGTRLLIITSELKDPVYLQGPYVFNTVFEKEADGSKWDPSPCSLTSDP